MTLLIRFVLISTIIYLIIRAFNRYFEEMNNAAREREHKNENTSKSKGVSKEIGEYTDYEEID